MAIKLQFGIVGLGQSGKTTVFNALSSAGAAVGDYSASKSPNIAMVKIPDRRVVRLGEIFDTTNFVYGEIEFIDIAGLAPGASLTKDNLAELFKEGSYIQAIRPAQALLAVVRAFTDPQVPHPDGSVDPARDIKELESEMILGDLLQIEKRLERLEHLLKVKPSDRGKNELALLQRIETHLENEKPLRELEFVKEELAVIGSFGFLSLKPVLYLLNLGEDNINSGHELEKSVIVQTGKKMAIASLCGKIEMEIAALLEGDRAEFLQALGIDEPAFAAVMSKSFELLGYISFLTASEKEARAWPIPNGFTAFDGAGEVHSDIQRGFIKAEVISYNELDSIGDWHAAKKQGKIRLEGKSYVIQDGDIILYRFNV